MHNIIAKTSQTHDERRALTNFIMYTQRYATDNKLTTMS